MYCVKCGNELKEGVKFCTKCGSSVNTNIKSNIHEKNVSLNESDFCSEQGRMDPVGGIDWNLKVTDDENSRYAFEYLEVVEEVLKYALSD